MSYLERFLDETLPALVRSNALVVHTPPDTRRPVIYGVSGPELYQLSGGPRLRTGSLATYVRDTDWFRGQPGDRHAAILEGAREVADNPGLVYRHPEALRHTVDTLHYSPTLRWDGRTGRYVSPPRGWCEDLRTFSLAEKYEPKPVDNPILVHFFDRLRLDPGNRARVLGFLAGALLRQCFGPMPALLIRSPYKGTGKSTIAKLVCHVATGQDQVHPQPWVGDGDLRKSITDTLASPVMWFDNISIEPRGVRAPVLRSPIINAATQSGSVRARVLGESRTAACVRPTFILTMQGGQIDPDIVDRFLYVLLPDPPPEDITPANDILPLVAGHWADIRDEVAQFVMNTEPLVDLAARPNPARHYRFTDFYRHVAPVVAAAGLDPAAIADDAAGEANAVHMELVAALAAGPADADTLLARIQPHTTPTLLATLPPETGARRATLRYYLKSLPSIVHGTGYRYRVLCESGKYRVEVE